MSCRVNNMLSRSLHSHKHFFFVGGGGVGKTTLAAAWAAELSKHHKKVGLVTIDPSRRLGAEMGMDIESQSQGLYETAGGAIDVFLIQPQQIINHFVETHFSQSDRERLKASRLYEQVSKHLAGNLSVATVYQLSHLLKSDEYDAFVVDTPPAGHTLDFFSSPAQVREVFKQSLAAKVFEKTKGLGLLSTQNIFLKAMSYLVGQEFTNEMAIFFQLVSLFQQSVLDNVDYLQRQMSAPEVAMLLVSGAEPMQLRQAKQIYGQLTGQGFIVNDVIVNRVRPYWLENWPGLKLDHTDEVSRFYKQATDYYEQHLLAIKDIWSSVRSDLEISFLPESAYYQEGYNLSQAQALLSKHLQGEGV